MLDIEGESDRSIPAIIMATIYSFVSLTSIMKVYCRLSKRDRNILTRNDNLL